MQLSGLPVVGLLPAEDNLEAMPTAFQELTQRTVDSRAWANFKTWKLPDIEKSN